MPFHTLRTRGSQLAEYLWPSARECLANGTFTNLSALQAPLVRQWTGGRLPELVKGPF